MVEGVAAMNKVNILPLFGLAVCALPFICSAPALAEEAKAGEPKMLSGMSVVGNSEAPKSLFIVPWKSSRIDFDTSLRSGLMDESLQPVDKEVFMRELDYYEIRQAQ